MNGEFVYAAFYNEKYLGTYNIIENELYDLPEDTYLKYLGSNFWLKKAQDWIPISAEDVPKDIKLLSLMVS